MDSLNLSFERKLHLNILVERNQGQNQLLNLSRFCNQLQNQAPIVKPNPIPFIYNNWILWWWFFFFFLNFSWIIGSHPRKFYFRKRRVFSPLRTRHNRWVFNVSFHNLLFDHREDCKDCWHFVEYQASLGCLCLLMGCCF